MEEGSTDMHIFSKKPFEIFFPTCQDHSKNPIPELCHIESFLEAPTEGGGDKQKPI